MAEQKKENINWSMKGKWIKNCSCNPGCPCDFWAEPTHHECEGMLAMEVDDGHFDNISLKGVKFAVTYHWPGPLYKGNGTVQPILDEKTNQKQREAILTILKGEAGNPWFEVVASLVSTLLEPKIAPIHFEHDLKNRTAYVKILGVLETMTEPIKNIANGDEHRILVQLPNGMEYKTAEIATAVVNKGFGQIRYNCPNGHSSLAYVEHTQLGLKS